MKIIHTDNFNGDYPDEKFVVGLPNGIADHFMIQIANICNDAVGPNHPRFWKVVPDDYKLQPGFEP